MNVKCFVFLTTILQIANTLENGWQNYDDYFDFEPDMDNGASLNSLQKPNKLLLNGLTHSDIKALSDLAAQIPTTECVTIEPLNPLTPKVSNTLNSIEQQQQSQQQEIPNFTNKPQNGNNNNVLKQPDNINREEKAKELKNLIQLLYVAQARVQLEAAEIKKAQAIANSAQQTLEEAANHVRSITAALQNSQQEVASAAIRAQTAQLQLAAHDQLLFAARQDVDALSSQMVGLQAAEGITQPKITVDLNDLLEKLKQPLQESEKPTPVPTVIPINFQVVKNQANNNNRLQHLKENYHEHNYYK